jgi:hypothetical protein
VGMTVKDELGRMWNLATVIQFKQDQFFFFSFSGRGETESTWYVGHCWPIVPAPDDR